MRVLCTGRRFEAENSVHKNKNMIDLCIKRVDMGDMEAAGNDLCRLVGYYHRLENKKDMNSIVHVFLFSS